VPTTGATALVTGASTLVVDDTTGATAPSTGAKAWFAVSVTGATAPEATAPGAAARLPPVVGVVPPVG
jgi:hypothetical protein